MRHHPYFELLFHEDQELADILGAAVVTRATLHEWPLSCVQRVTLADGRKMVYKAQREPTVEPAVYATVDSALLPTAETLLDEPPYAAMVIEWVDAPRVDDAGLDEAALVRLGRELEKEIGALGKGLPCYEGIGNAASWRAHVDETLATMAGLIASKKFARLDDSAVALLRRGADAPEVLAAFEHTHYLQGDLSGDNILLAPGGYRVIDWQRPLYGPAGLDVASLLISQGIDPVPHVGRGVLWIRRYLYIAWMTACGARWIPYATSYDQQIAELLREE